MRGTKAHRLRPLDLSPFRPELDALTPDRRAALDAVLTGASLAEIADRLAAGTLTAEELTLGALDRIDRFDGALGAVVEVDPGCLADARAADRRRRGGGVLGPLDGVPVTVKDNIGTAGPMRTTGGAMVLADHVATADAAVVAALRRAGAIVVGKANLSELAGAVCKTPGVSAVGGPTRNPYGTDYSSGGSSSGSAVAVAAGLCVVSVGTETSGSLLAPSAFCGVVGIKPTVGRASGDGVIPLVRRQDTPGAVGRSVADAATLLAALSDVDVDPATLDAAALAGVRVGVLRDDILTQQSPFEDTSDAEAVLGRIMDGLTGAGATTVPVTLPSDRAGAFEAAFTRVVLGGLTWDTTDYLRASGTGVDDLPGLQRFNLADPKGRMPQGQLFVDLAVLYGISRQDYETSSRRAGEEAVAILEAAFADADTDLLVSITNRHSSLYATGGYPAVTVPLGVRSDGMPTGVTMIGRRGDDARLVGRAFAFEQATRLRVPPPVDPR